MFFRDGEYDVLQIRLVVTGVDDSGQFEYGVSLFTLDMISLVEMVSMSRAQLSALSNLARKSGSVGVTL